jgi:hypothetical protein
MKMNARELPVPSASTSNDHAIQRHSGEIVKAAGLAGTPEPFRKPVGEPTWR